MAFLWTLGLGKGNEFEGQGTFIQREVDCGTGHCRVLGWKAMTAKGHAEGTERLGKEGLS